GPCSGDPAYGRARPPALSPPRLDLDRSPRRPPVGSWESPLLVGDAVPETPARPSSGLLHRPHGRAERVRHRRGGGTIGAPGGPGEQDPSGQEARGAGSALPGRAPVVKTFGHVSGPGRLAG